MKISQEDAILVFKKSLSVKAVWCMETWVNCLTRVGNLEASTVCKRESAGRVQLSGNQAVVDRVRHIAVEDNCAQSAGKANKALISSWEFAWNCCSPFKYAQDNLPWSPAQMLQM